MTFELPAEQTRLLSNNLIQPQIVMRIDGIDTIFGVGKVYDYVHVGDPGLLVGGDWVVGDIGLRDDGLDIIKTKGTTQTISQQLEPDRGAVSSVGTFTVALVDFQEQMTEIISPGFVVDDILGREAQIWLGFDQSAFPNEFFVVFRGIIDEIKAQSGEIMLTISHPDQIKLQKIFSKVSHVLAGSSSLNVGFASVEASLDQFQAANSFTNGQEVTISTSGTLPTGITALTTYYIVGATQTTFQISAAKDGQPVNITTQGTGTHSVNYTGVNAADTTIHVDDTTGFLVAGTGPDGGSDSSMMFYVRIDDELIQYTGTTSTTLTGCTRGCLGTTAASHETAAGVDSFIRLTGNFLDLALKLMLSGVNGYFKEDIAISSINNVDTNALFFSGVYVEEEYGLRVGDYVTTVDNDDAGNNFALKQILSLDSDTTGSWIIIDGVTTVLDLSPAGTVKFRSQYDVFGADAGFGMAPYEVDVAQHLDLQRLFFSSFDLDIYIKDTIQGKEFLEKEIYLPAACYGVPRKARSSVAFHIGPIPGSDIPIIDQDAIVDPSKIQIKRSIGRNFYNTVVVAYDENALDDKFASVSISDSEDSRTRIPKPGTRALIIKSKGLRTSSSGDLHAQSAAERRLLRYQYGAEYIEGLQLQYASGFTIEIGDLVLFDGEGLEMSDTTNGTRAFGQRFFEVINKTLDIVNGRVSVSMIDTSYSTDVRYGLIGISSMIASGASTTNFTIEEHFFSVFGASEWKKWARYTSPVVQVRSGATVNTNRVITGITGNSIQVSPPLTFTPAAGDIMELDTYANQTDEIKAIYAFLASGASLSDGSDPYQMV